MKKKNGGAKKGIDSFNQLLLYETITCTDTLYI